MYSPAFKGLSVIAGALPAGRKSIELSLVLLKGLILVNGDNARYK